MHLCTIVIAALLNWLQRGMPIKVCTYAVLLMKERSTGQYCEHRNCTVLLSTVRHWYLLKNDVQMGLALDGAQVLDNVLVAQALSQGTPHHEEGKGEACDGLQLAGGKERRGMSLEMGPGLGFRGVGGSSGQERHAGLLKKTQEAGRMRLYRPRMTMLSGAWER